MAQSSPADAFELENGLTVILRPSSSSLVTVSVQYNVGPANEKEGQSGFAHLFEHLLLGDTDHIPVDRRRRAFAEVAAGTDAFTDADLTTYYSVGASGALETLLWFHSDQMGFARAALTAPALDREKSVVLNELRQRSAAPLDRASRAATRLLFPPPHPYSGQVSGSEADIQSATPRDMLSFYEAFYVPNNASIAIVGGFDPDEARDLVRKYFGGIPPRRVDRIHIPRPRPLTANRVEELPTDDKSPSLALAWRGPGDVTSNEAAAFTVLAEYFGDTRSSRLTEVLVDAKLAVSAKCNYWFARHGSTFDCRVRGREGVALGEIERVFETELHTVLERDIPRERLERAKLLAEASLVRRIEGVRARAHRLNWYYAHTGSPDGSRRLVARVRALTAKRLRDALAPWLSSGRAVVRVRSRP